jgi:hypothetical protein
VSLEKNLPETVDVKGALWSASFPGQSAPVVANGKLYIMGYIDEGPDLREGVACFDAKPAKSCGAAARIISATRFTWATRLQSDHCPRPAMLYARHASLAAFTADGKCLETFDDGISGV